MENIYSIEGVKNFFKTTWGTAFRSRDVEGLCEELLTALSDAANRLEFLTGWIENSYGGSNQDVELGRGYARAARAAVAYAETETLRQKGE